MFVIEKDNINAGDILLYTKHLEGLKEDTNVRYKDLDNLNVPSQIIKPFERDIADMDFSLQAENQLSSSKQVDTPNFGVEKTFAQNTSD